MADYSKFKVGDRVRVSSDRDATIYEITQILDEGGGCYIREEGMMHGKPFREQRFDLSMLRPAERNQNGRCSS